MVNVVHGHRHSPLYGIGTSISCCRHLTVNGADISLVKAQISHCSKAQSSQRIRHRHLTSIYIGISLA